MHSYELSGNNPKKMNKFPALPLLEEMYGLLLPAASNLDNKIFVCVQHLLETTGSLIEIIIRLGVRPERIYVMGKLYSTNIEVFHRLRATGVKILENTIPKDKGDFAKTLDQDVITLWKTVYEEAIQDQIKSIIVLDDGGHCLANIPSKVRERWSIVGIEQTTSGLQNRELPGTFPVIEVASSAAKRHIEPPMISETLLSKIHSLIPLDHGSTKCGVIGLGNIGQAITKDLLRLGHSVYVYDRNPSLAHSITGARWCDGFEKIFSQVEYIFGCTGQDIMKDVVVNDAWLNKVGGEKFLISCSSEEKEFLSLLKFFNNELQSRNHDSLQTISCQLPHGTLTILRGGFPVNFDSTPESVHAMDIQMTRGLLLGGIAQAILSDYNRIKTDQRWRMLKPEIQKYVVTRWLKLRVVRVQWYSPDMLEGFKKLDWIREHSSGHEFISDHLSELFNN